MAPVRAALTARRARRARGESRKSCSGLHVQFGRVGGGSMIGVYRCAHRGDRAAAPGARRYRDLHGRRRDQAAASRRRRPRRTRGPAPPQLRRPHPHPHRPRTSAPAAHGPRRPPRRPGPILARAAADVLVHVQPRIYPDGALTLTQTPRANTTTLQTVAGDHLHRMPCHPGNSLGDTGIKHADPPNIGADTLPAPDLCAPDVRPDKARTSGCRRVDQPPRVSCGCGHAGRAAPGRARSPRPPPRRAAGRRCG
ncbi:hypothetical protein Ga0074812_10738 [Parafrankia irregularis]|uniref:Uncharacterized protein n=1 Tax=Parafrankia irregularis TaxID=795642 RepID=A0A0S4QNV2_9ACTN|nr:hypothetical protein Ga0074812_10738 [Parafrankia irregularis]